MSLTFCLGKFTLSLWSSWWTSPMLKVPSPFLSASEKVCRNHVHLQLRLINRLNVMLFFLMTNNLNTLKDIGHGCAACGPNCLHHWFQPSGTSAQWSRCEHPLRWWRPGPGTSLELHNKYWSNSLGWNGFLRTVWRSRTFSPHKLRGWNQ